MRAQILSRKISPKAFVERKGEGKGDIGIEGTAIEAADEVRSCCGGCWQVGLGHATLCRDQCTVLLRGNSFNVKHSQQSAL